MIFPSPLLMRLRRLSAPLATAMVASLLSASAAVSVASLGGADHVVVHAGSAVKPAPGKKEY